MPNRRAPSNRPLSWIAVQAALLAAVHAGAAWGAPPAQEVTSTAFVVAGDAAAGFEDGTPGRFDKPIRLAPFGPDAILVADINNHAIRVVTRKGAVRTIAGGPDRKGHRDGAAAEACFHSPHGVAFDPATGRIAVAEASGHTIRFLTPSSPAADAAFVVSTPAGKPGETGFRDGPAAEALFSSPHAVAWTPDGGLLIADIGNARIRLLREGRVRTVAGSGESGSRDGEALQATFVYPMDLAPGGDHYLVADAGAHRIRTVIPGVRVATVSLAAQAELQTPHGVAAGPDGTVYVADMGSHRVLAIDAQGRVRTISGTGSAGSGPHELSRPAAVLAHSGLLWIADLGNHRIVAVPLE